MLSFETVRCPQGRPLAPPPFWPWLPLASEEVCGLPSVLHAKPTYCPFPGLQATRIFVSNLNAKMAQRFLALVLLPRVREDIRVNKRLHFALFQAMKKAAYKPGAFYKVLPCPIFLQTLP